MKAGPPQTEAKSNRVALLLILASLVPIAICLSGILAAIAIPALIDYLQRAKTQEPRANLARLRTLVQDHCEREGHLVAGSAGPLPANPTIVQLSPDFSADPIFAQLRFSPREVYYSYSIEEADSGLVLIAEGDLDEDGERSTFSYDCASDCRCASELHILNEWE